MAAALINGAVQVVYKNKENGKFVLDTNNLSKILKGVEDKELAIISIAGAYRKGKSFLLNFILRYFQHAAQDNDGDWLGDKPLSGFNWKNGSTRDTEGILMWGTPFVIKRPSGGEIAVLLMDTQGVFDCNETKEGDTTIFALSLLTSSILIYNVHSQIGSDCLEHFQYFTEYARLIRESNHTQAPSEKLIFLVRDWQCPYEYSYGPEGGKKLLDSTLKASEKDPEEVRKLKFGVSSSRKLSCSLLPYPGKKVATQKQFQGNILDIDEDFIGRVKEFMNYELTPGVIPVKEIGGTTVKGRDFLKFFEAYVAAFQSGDLPIPQTAYQMIVQVGLDNISKEAARLYEQKMTEVVNSPQYLDDAQLATVHSMSFDEALKLFQDTKKMGDADTVAKSYEQLKTDLNERLRKIKDINDRKRPQDTSFKFATMAAAAGVGTAVGGAVMAAVGVTVVATGPIGWAVALVVGTSVSLLGTAATTFFSIKIHRCRRASRDKKDE